MSTANDIESLSKLAKKHLRQGRLQEAIESFQQILELDETRVDIHEGLATAFFMASLPEKAVEHFKRVTELDPRQGRSLINLGAAYNRIGNFDEAIKVLRRGIQKDKSHSEGFYNLGFAYRGLNQLSMAVSAYREAVRIDPKRADAHANLGNVYIDLGNNQQAIMHFKQALEIDPDFERAKRGLEIAQQAIQQAKSAISPFGRLVDQNSLGPKSVAKVERQLNDTERMKDRQRTYRLVTEIKSQAKAFLQQLTAEFEPQLTELSRAAADGQTAPAALNKAIGSYQAALKQSADLRRALKQSLLELRAHEEFMNTPPVRAPK